MSTTYSSDSLTLNGPASSTISLHCRHTVADLASIRCAASSTPFSMSCVPAVPGRYLPSNFPPWQTVFYHLRRVRLEGSWHRLYRALHRAECECAGRNPDPSATIMDSQSVKTVEESACMRGYDAHKCMKGRKRDPLVETLGLPIASDVTPPMSMTRWVRANSWAGLRPSSHA
jgi:transposase